MTTQLDMSLTGTKGAEIQSATPADLLKIAVSQDVDIEKLEKLMEMQERWEAREAKKLFIQAMTKFRNECPAIIKNRAVDFTSSKGRTNYSYAGLPETIEQIKKLMQSCGLSHTWKIPQQTPELITVACHLCHIAGHEESTSLSGPPDGTGNKSALKAIGSTVTHLERYTLFAILGLASAEDNDGGEPVETISKEQKLKILALLEEVKGDKDKFCKAFKIESLDKLPLDQLPKAIKSIEKKRQV